MRKRSKKNSQRKRKCRLKGVLSFLSETLGEVTAEVSGTWGPWKEVTRQLETLLPGSMLPNDFYTIGSLKVPKSLPGFPSPIGSSSY